jgi:hypothetical protein
VKTNVLENIAMNTDAASELLSFQSFIGEIVSRGDATASPEEALDEWRVMHPSDDDLLAVREALDDMNAGDTGVSLEEFENQFRSKHSLPNQQ